MSSSIHLTESNLVVITVVKDIHEIAVERVYFLKNYNTENLQTNLHFRKLVDNLSKFIVQRLLQKLDFSSIESPNTADSILTMNNCRCFALCLRKNDFFQILNIILICRMRTYSSCGDDSNSFEIILRRHVVP